MIDSWAAVDVAAPAEGTMAAVDVDGTFVAIGTLAGTLAAFDETCTHRARPPAPPPPSAAPPPTGPAPFPPAPSPTARSRPPATRAASISGPAARSTDR